MPVDEQREEREFAFTLSMGEGYRFTVEFDQEGVPPLLLDEPPPLGEGAGPNAARLLAAAVGNCLSASLLFCLRKSRVEPDRIRTRVEGRLARNDEGRMRIAGLKVRIDPDLPAEARKKLERCEGLFEDFCVVTASVRDGIDVEVEIAVAGETAAV